MRPAYGCEGDWNAKRDLSRWAEQTMRDAVYLDQHLPRGVFLTWLSREVFDEKSV